MIRFVSRIETYLTTLLDAQSFLWMLWNVDDKTLEYKASVSSMPLADKNSTNEDTLEDFADASEKTDPFESEVVVESASFKEGKQKQFFGTKYERDPRVRKAFLAKMTEPYRCEACGMDFESVYGELGKGVIEVHHKKPLYIDGVEQEIQPTSEYLACLCANCHRMIHKPKNKVMSVEELRQLIGQQSLLEADSDKKPKKLGIKVKNLPKASLK